MAVPAPPGISRPLLRVASTSADGQLAHASAKLKDAARADELKLLCIFTNLKFDSVLFFTFFFPKRKRAEAKFICVINECFSCSYTSGSSLSLQVEIYHNIIVP